MDLVFKRYTSPFFLNLCIENSDLSNFVDVLLKKQDEEMMWEMYLATLPYNEKTFNEWKEENGTIDTTKEVQKMSKREFDATIQKAQDILREFKPPAQKVQKGGS